MAAKQLQHLKTGQFVWFSGHEKQNGRQKWSGANFIIHGLFPVIYGTQFCLLKNM
jgi:hypothetical protein